MVFPYLQMVSIVLTATKSYQRVGSPLAETPKTDKFHWMSACFPTIPTFLKSLQPQLPHHQDLLTDPSWVSRTCATGDGALLQGEVTGEGDVNSHDHEAARSKVTSKSWRFSKQTVGELESRNVKKMWAL